MPVQRAASDAAERFIATIPDRAKSRNARDYALMEEQEFRARMGIAVEDVQQSVKEIRDVIVPKTQNAIQSIPRPIIAGGGVGFGAVIIEAIRRWL